MTECDGRFKEHAESSFFSIILDWSLIQQKQNRVI